MIIENNQLTTLSNIHQIRLLILTNNMKKIIIIKRPSNHHIQQTIEVIRRIGKNKIILYFISFHPSIHPSILSPTRASSRNRVPCIASLAMTWSFWRTRLEIYELRGTSPLVLRPVMRTRGWSCLVWIKWDTFRKVDRIVEERRMSPLT